jgi:hypothetical protein
MARGLPCPSTLAPWKTAEHGLRSWFRPVAYGIVTKAPLVIMEQKPRKDVSEDKVVPEPPAAPPPEDPAPAMRPEDEALVAERLRELGYIE